MAALNLLFRLTSSFLLGSSVVYYRATWRAFQPKLKKIKIHPENFLIFPEMELSNSKIKKFLIFSQKKSFLIFPEMEPCTFQLKLEKIKKSTPRKFLKFQEREIPKKFLFQRKLFLYFRKRKPRKIIFISGNGIFLCFRKLFIFQEVTLQDQTFFILFLIKKQNFLN